MNFQLLKSASGLARPSTLMSLLCVVATTSGFAQAENRPEQIYRPRGNFEDNVARPLRYTPDNGDFVITNGAEFFNRPLYGANTAFRIDGGDKPELSLYLPGRGGNLRFGIQTTNGMKWLNGAETVVTRYRAGELIYDVSDSALGDGTLELTVLPMDKVRGVVGRAQLQGATSPITFIMAYGGANGMRGRRGGDIGCEREPVSEFFQLKPDQCKGNEFSITTNTFVLHSKPATIAGVFPRNSKLRIADATNWDSIGELLSSTNDATEFPLLVCETALSNAPVTFALQQMDGVAPELKEKDLPRLFGDADAHRSKTADRVHVETPDEFINAAVPALNIAADAIWDSQQQAYMHGAVAWRVRLLGWRGSYAGDALGWHERTAAHFASFAQQQNTNPVPDSIPPADEASNLARNETALHSNGDMTRSHYDMNLVGVDAFFRHLLWTGDLEFARTNWPVIERHLAWERRLFRREFGPDKLPLYEAYAAIWASDDLSYNGGGTAHASAYNYWHNKMAARVAKLIGADAAPYEHEADLILRAMRKYLWSDKEGNFAECKDLLGLQLTHPNAGLWTFYHTMDSEVPSAKEAASMARWIDENIAHIPIQTSNIQSPFVLAETSWMPYQWSLNNVVVAENAHTALGFWQANRPETAFANFKGVLLDTMFLGLCPGNVGCMTSHDMARGEAQRDFADGIGITSRALVEGLFGVRPDVLAGQLKVVPGFPADWRFAKIQHPDFAFEFHREGLTESCWIKSAFPKPMALTLELPAHRGEIASATVNGKPVKWKTVETFGVPRIEIRCEPAASWKVEIGLNPHVSAAKESIAGSPAHAGQTNEPGSGFDWKDPLPESAKLETIDLRAFFNDRVTEIFNHDYRSPRSPFCSLATPKQGIGGWCEPNAHFDVDDSGLRATAAKSAGKISLPNGVPFATPSNANAKNILFTSQWDNFPHEVSVPLSGKASHAFLLMAGSTSALQSRFDNGEVIVHYTDGTTERLALRNPDNWWPIDQDYFIDDFAFRRDGPIPPRLDLKTGNVRLLDPVEFKGKGGVIPGGAATILDLPLNHSKRLKSLTVRALANEVVIGLMAVTLER